MRLFSIALVLLCALLTGNISPLVANAQGAVIGTVPDPTPAPQMTPIGQNIPDNTSQQVAGPKITSQFGSKMTATAGLAADNRNYKPEKFGCAGGKNMTDVVKGCIAYVLYLGTELAMYVAFLVSVILNYAVLMLVIGMGKLVGNMPGITSAWQTLRDLVTVFLVFLTIFIGLGTIVNSSKYGSKQLLMKVILAAIFVNFSITLAKVVIDISNVVAVETYKKLVSMNTDDGIRSQLTDFCLNSNDQAAVFAKDSVCLNHGVATAFWSQLKITSILDKAPANPRADEQWGFIITFAMGIPLFLVLAYVLGAGAFMLIGRFVILLYLIIMSPIGLVAWITGVSGVGKDWWKKLINQSILAPFLFLMWWIALKITHDFGLIFDNAGTLNGENMQSVNGVGIVMNFVIIISLLLVGLSLTQKLGGKTADVIMGGYKKAKNYAVGAAVGAGAVAGGYAYQKSKEGAGVLHRNTAGRVSQWAGNKYASAQARAKDEPNKYGKTPTGSLMRLTSKWRKLDRGIQAALEAPSKKGVGGARSMVQRDADELKLRKERNVQIDTASKKNKLTDDADFLKRHHGKTAAQIAADMSTPAIAASVGVSARPEVRVTEEQAKQRLAEAKRTISFATQAQLEAMRDKDPDRFKHESMYESFTASQMKGFEENPQFALSEVSKMQEHRQSVHDNAIMELDTAGNAVPNEQVVRSIRRNLSEGERKAIGRGMAQHATEVGRLESIFATLPATATTATRDAALKARDNARKQLGAHLNTITPQDIVHLSDEAIMQPFVVAQLTGAQLRALDKPDAERLTQTQRQKIRDDINRDPTAQESAKDYLKSSAAKHLWK